MPPQKDKDGPGKKFLRVSSCSQPAFHTFASDSWPPITASRVTEGGKLVGLARRLRERREEALMIAENFRDPEARRMMIEVAERYEKFAARLEAESDV
jgi:hypothetical protein